MDWQPIETAPRDGTPILLYFPPQTLTEKRFVGGDGWRLVEYEFKHGVWCCEWGGGALWGGQWRLSRCGDDEYYPEGNPSHWMHLPEPPKPA